MIKTFLLVLGISVNVFAANKINLGFDKICQGIKCVAATSGTNLFKLNGFFDPKYSVSYFSKETNFTDLNCYKNNNCFLFLGQVADSYAVFVNKIPITNLISDKNNFILYEYSAIPLPSSLLNSKTIIQIDVQDLNRSTWGLMNPQIFVSSWGAFKHHAYASWLTETGLTLFSSYTMLIFCILAGVMLVLVRHKDIGLIFLYSLVAFIYLLSFSEVPRGFYKPMELSGAVHFPLRLLQDLLLFLTFNEILNKEKRFSKFFISVFFFYTILIIAYPAVWFAGGRGYSLYKEIIIFGAPLVAFPMGWGLFLTNRLARGFEKSLLLPLFFLLFLFQVNDLLNFWQLINTFYTVKFYIPFIVILLFFIELRRSSIFYSETSLLADKVQLAKQVMHDIRSPLAALKAVSNQQNWTDKHRVLLEKSIIRIDGIANSLLKRTRIGFFNIVPALHKVIDEKTNQILGKNISIEYQSPDQLLLTRGSEVDFENIISNIIENAIEAKNNTLTIHVSAKEVGRGKIAVSIKDNGRGIPKQIIKKIGSYGFSYGKKTSDTAGNGLGLYHAIQTIENWGGYIDILSNENVGTEVSVFLNQFKDR